MATFCRSKDRIRNACFFFYVELHRNTFFLSNSFHAESQSPNSGNSQPLCSISDLFCQTFCLVTRGLPSFPSWRALFYFKPQSRASPHRSLVSWCPHSPINVSLNPSAYPCVLHYWDLSLSFAFSLITYIVAWFSWMPARAPCLAQTEPRWRHRLEWRFHREYP